MVRITLAYALGLAIFVVLVDSGTLRDVALFANRLPMLDKVVHFAMFGLLALLANLTLCRSGRWPVGVAIAAGSVFVLIVSTAEECSNLFVPWRTCSLADLAANYLGIVCLGILPLASWHSRHRNLPASRTPV